MHLLTSFFLNCLLFLAEQGLHCCSGFALAAASGPLMVVASLVATPGL